MAVGGFGQIIAKCSLFFGSIPKAITKIKQTMSCTPPIIPNFPNCNSDKDKVIAVIFPNGNVLFAEDAKEQNITKILAIASKVKHQN